MRELKFRAWDGENMLNLYNTSRLALHPDLDVDGVFVPFCDEYKVMQFTGLYDKNGKEIYEGDIVKIKSLYGDRKYQKQIVCWDNKEYGWSPFNTHFYDAGLAYDDENCKVIGNVYEHPELLKEG